MSKCGRPGYWVVIFWRSCECFGCGGNDFIRLSSGEGIGRENGQNDGHRVFFGLGLELG